MTIHDATLTDTYDLQSITTASGSDSRKHSKKQSGFVHRYYEIDRFGKEMSYQYFKFIDGIENPVLARLVALGIPFSCAISMLCKLISDICRCIDTIVSSIHEREMALGNLLTIVVDIVEYGRQIFGVVFGAFIGLCSPSFAIQSFLTNPVDESVNYINPIKSAQLYSMADTLHHFFVKHEIDYRICCGTALGARREGGIIRNDDDIDLMLHPESIEALQALIEDGTFSKETGISISAQPWTGGWQCFFGDCEKGPAGSPLEEIGHPFIDIFPGVYRQKRDAVVISYGENRMYNLSRNDYFTLDEWNDPPKLYTFGPTQMYGTPSIDAYLKRAYGPLSLEYTAVIYPHDMLADAYASPLSTFSLMAQTTAPRNMRHEKMSPQEFDSEEYDRRCASPQ